MLLCRYGNGNKISWSHSGVAQVLPTLQVEGSPTVFAIGDCNDVAETKLGYFAAFQANRFSEPHALQTDDAAFHAVLYALCHKV